MGDRKEQLKQWIAIELENARLWAAVLLPSIGLDLALIFTNKFFADNITAKFAMGAVVLMWVLFVFYMRNEHLKRANDKIKEL